MMSPELMQSPSPIKAFINIPKSTTKSLIDEISQNVIKYPARETLKSKINKDKLCLNTRKIELNEQKQFLITQQQSADEVKIFLTQDVFSYKTKEKRSKEVEIETETIDMLIESYTQISHTNDDTIYESI
jgi:hypothetical protein